MLDSDAQLIDRCLRGDQAAWTALVDRYSGLVYSISRRMMLPSEVCDDVAQIVFATFSRQLANIRSQESLAGWFGMVTRREGWRAKKRLRRAAVTEVSLEVEPAAEAAEVDADEQKIAIRTAVQQLGPPCRELISMLFFSDPEPSYNEVAERLGIATGSIGPTRRRCLARLSENLRHL